MSRTKKKQQKRTRRHYTPEQKAALLQRHITDKVPISEICNEERLRPSADAEGDGAAGERRPMS